ncbi:hypothetical protein T4A_3109 [Trichinella pseudospiralis]|uniref:Uncharacterized protein n=1 Tax=Trichinella pseudospiralis TaxID=6337 RepID=A0A0V1ES00_TRIPS|nr:hypothetical protein T4A_3109 [Trichinella pseudospiralis]
MWNFLYVENVNSMKLDDHCLAGIGVRFSDAYLREENRNVDCPQVTHSSDNRMLPVPVAQGRFGAFELCHSCRMSNLAKVNCKLPDLHERDSPLTEIGQRPPLLHRYNQSAEAFSSSSHHFLSYKSTSASESGSVSVSVSATVAASTTTTTTTTTTGGGGGVDACIYFTGGNSLLKQL